MLLLLLFLLPISCSSSNNEHPVCSTYGTFEKQYKCGKDGYFVGYGQRYCNRFFDKEYYSRFNNVGKQFVNCTGPCLTAEMGSILKLNPKLDCATIISRAFSTHVDCYVKCGFCKACKTNKDALSRIYEFKDFLSTRALETVEDTLKKCGGIISGALNCLAG